MVVGWNPLNNFLNSLILELHIPWNIHFQILNPGQLSKPLPNGDSTLAAEIASSKIQMQPFQMVVGCNPLHSILNTLIFEFIIPWKMHFQILNFGQLSKQLPKGDSTLAAELAIFKIQMQPFQMVVGWYPLNYVPNTLILEFTIIFKIYFQILNHMKLSTEFSNEGSTLRIEITWIKPQLNPPQVVVIWKFYNNSNDFTICVFKI